MLRAYGRAFVQLLDPRILRIVVLSLVVTVAIYAVLIVALVWGLSQVDLAQTPWLNYLARWGSGLGAVLVAALLFPGAVTVVMALWQDRVIDAVEARYYPGLPPARPVPRSEVVGGAARLLILTVLLNLALLPVYLALILVPPTNAIAFAVANGMLLGREYFDAVALRRLSPEATASLRQRGRRTVWGAGVLAALVLTVPGLNFIGPVLATAAFVHIFHDRRAVTRQS